MRGCVHGVAEGTESANDITVAWTPGEDYNDRERDGDHSGMSACSVAARHHSCCDGRDREVDRVEVFDGSVGGDGLARGGDGKFLPKKSRASIRNRW